MISPVSFRGIYEIIGTPDQVSLLYRMIEDKNKEKDIPTVNYRNWAPDGKIKNESRIIITEDGDIAEFMKNLVPCGLSDPRRIETQIGFEICPVVNQSSPVGATLRLEQTQKYDQILKNNYYFADDILKNINKFDTVKGGITKE